MKKLLVFLCTTVLVVGMLGVAAAIPVGYSVRSNFDDHLYSIDLNTGQATDLGLVNFGDAEGLAFVGSDLYAIGGTEEEFWSIGTPPGSKVGDTGSRDGIDAGLDYDQTSGTMYNINASSSGSSLYTINLLTGAATLVGTSVTFGDGLAINSAGDAFAADFYLTDSLYSVNLSTGALTIVGSLGGEFSAQCGLSFDESGILWALTDDGEIYTLSTSTGVATFANNVTFGGERIAGFEGLGIPSAPVPEPATMLLLGSGLLGLAGFRRRFRKG